MSASWRCSPASRDPRCLAPGAFRFTKLTAEVRQHGVHCVECDTFHQAPILVSTTVSQRRRHGDTSRKHGPPEGETLLTSCRRAGLAWPSAPVSSSSCSRSPGRPRGRRRPTGASPGSLSSQMVRESTSLTAAPSGRMGLSVDRGHRQFVQSRSTASPNGTSICFTEAAERSVRHSGLPWSLPLPVAEALTGQAHGHRCDGRADHVMKTVGHEGRAHAYGALQSRAVSLRRATTRVRGWSPASLRAGVWSENGPDLALRGDRGLGAIE